jgi:hypothetical protein
MLLTDVQRSRHCAGGANQPPQTNHVRSGRNGEPARSAAREEIKFGPNPQGEMSGSSRKGEKHRR